MRNTNRKNFLTVLVIVFFALIALPIESGLSYAQTKTYNWRMPSLLMRGTAAEIVREQWCKDLEVATNGRIKIAYYGAGEIIPVGQMWDAVSNGVIDITFSYAPIWKGKTPTSMFSEGIPFTLYDVGEFNALLYEYGLEKVIRKAYAKKGVHLLRVLPAFNNSMITNFPYKSFDEFKKHKVRAGGAPAEMLKAAGVPTVYMMVPEVYAAMQRGVIDGTAAGPISYFYDMAYHEVCKYILVPGTGIEADEVLMNIKTWESLPKDLQMTLYHSVGELGVKLGANYYARDNSTLNIMRQKHGVKTITLDETEKNRMGALALKALDEIASKEKDETFSEATAILKKFLREAHRIE